MKRRIMSAVVTILLILTVAGCEKKSRNTMLNGDNFIEESKQQEAAFTDSIKEQKADEVEQKETSNNVVHDTMEDTDNLRIAAAETEEEALVPETIRIENPSWNYYIADKSKVTKNLTIGLKELSKESNNITDVKEWFIAHDLPLAWNTDYNSTYPFNSDENYDYIGEEFGKGSSFLKIYDKDTGNLIYDLDFSEYQYANDFLPQDKPYVSQEVWYSIIVDDVLYASIAHLTYAKSSPHNGYIVAIDLDDMSVLWKTKPLVSNAYSFAVVDDYIFSGYGFTEENDYLKIIDRETGTVMKEYPLDTMAEHIIYKDDILYVRTYNMNYTYEIVDNTDLIKVK